LRVASNELLEKIKVVALTKEACEVGRDSAGELVNLRVITVINQVAVFLECTESQGAQATGESTEYELTLGFGQLNTRVLPDQALQALKFVI
jgi:hypothetical protein